MSEERLRQGSLISTCGASLLAVSVFLPWYGVSFTASGIAYSQQQLQAVAAQFGNATFQSEVNGLHTKLGALSGQQIATLSAHDALKYLTWVLLILAAVAFISALLQLAGATGPSLASSGQVALIGAVATLFVLFRMVDRPVPEEGLVALSLGWGVWLALASSVAIMIGGLWPRRTGRGQASSGQMEQALEGLSGWTPEA